MKTREAHKKIYLLIGAAAIVLAAILAGIIGKKASKADEPLIGIAWRNDTDSEFYTNITAVLDELGADYVLLGEVTEKDLPYEDGMLAASCADENGILKQEYADLVKSASTSDTNAERVMDGIDGVIFTGGEDISPTLYAEPEEWYGIAEELDYNAERDVSDALLMAYCLEEDIPVMGFCRGMQMLGVVSGASVYQDLSSYFDSIGIEYDNTHRNQVPAGEYRDYASHDVSIIDTASVLYQIAQSDTLYAVPSWHHQALKSVEGTPLKVTGVTETQGLQVIEAIERTDKTFAVGFQFHPEASVVKHLNGDKNADEFMDAKMAEKFFCVFLKAAS